MYIFALFFLLFSGTRNLVSSENVLCESEIRMCVCRHKHHSNEDFLVLNVDCSFTNNKILESNYSLPSSASTLILSSNGLTNIVETNLLKSQTITKLLLNKNIISKIEINSLNLPNLTYLDLRENSLEYIDPEIFSTTKKLKYLNLALNKFTTFPNKVFHHLGTLEVIILDGNNIGEKLINSSLFQVNGLSLNTAIRKISIGNVNLNCIPENFLVDAYNLRSLTISKNHIKDIPELPFTLEFLDLSENPIVEIDIEDFSNFLALKELHLNNLQIKEVPDFVFEPLKALTKLYLERNLNMTRFSALAFGREVLDDPDYFNLEELSIRGSHIMTLSDDLLIPFQQLVKLDLQGNRWRCDCNIKWLKMLQIMPIDYENVRCYYPRSLYNSKIFELEDNNFKCKTDNGLGLASIALFTFTLIFVAIIVWFFFAIPRYQRRGGTLQHLMYPTASYIPIPLNLNNAGRVPY